MARLVFLMLSLCLCCGVEGHGRLMKPPSRSSMWRVGFPTPENYEDNQLNCGGKDRQYEINGGKCGICGDPFDGVRRNEAGGIYATGTIGRTYKQGQVIDVDVEITSAHGGWFEFRICANNDPSKSITQECLDRNILQEVGGSTRHIGVPSGGIEGAAYITMKYHLPDSLVCSQCVVQWKYHSAKDWGCGLVDGQTKCGIGFGDEEEFYGCADVAILPLTTGPTTTVTPVIDRTQTIGPTRKPTQTSTTHQPWITKQTDPAWITKPTGPNWITKPTGSSWITKPTGPTWITKPTGPNWITKSTSPTWITKAMGQTWITNQNGPTEFTRQGTIVPTLCEARGSLRNTLMDLKCRIMCSQGNCLMAFCNDACHRLVPK